MQEQLVKCVSRAGSVLLESDYCKLLPVLFRKNLWGGGLGGWGVLSTIHNVEIWRGGDEKQLYTLTSTVDSDSNVQYDTSQAV